jgi:SAM-dependent methyltransferase
MSDDLRQAEYWKSKTNSRPYSHPVVEFFARQRVRHLQPILNLNAETRLLDVGCGDGFSTYYVSEYTGNLFGIDRSEFMLANHPLRDAVVCGDAYHLPFQEKSFDLVWSWELLHHMANPELAVREMQRVSGKYLVIFEPNRYNPALFLYGLLKKEERLLWRSTKRYLRGITEAKGWEICMLENCGAILPNATPYFLFKLLRHLPFRLPLCGISIVLVARRVE